MLFNERFPCIMMPYPHNKIHETKQQPEPDDKAGFKQPQDSIYWEEGGLFSSFPSVVSDLDVATEVNARARSCGFDLL
jgi:hypothetical protein